ncbi:uncharacterized protein LOC132640818 isoform X2 [Lycium barbarum]|uniref:uncharacterized protein LOC132640818 isoform X2 n=1 Tax=Lycium barbarum TaxID=112863 RepID=UPI00293E5B20|nr:uncharacterized protein LOC132640818 isoform X2 [Lycium barbarum]
MKLTKYHYFISILRGKIIIALRATTFLVKLEKSPGILRFDCSPQLGSGSPSEFGQKSFFLADVVNAITQELCSNTLECVINRLKMAAQNFLSLETSGRSSQDRRDVMIKLHCIFQDNHIFITRLIILSLIDYICDKT